MFKAPFSFDGRIRRIEYFLSSFVASAICGIIWVIVFAGMMSGVMSGMTSGVMSSPPAALVGGSIFGSIVGATIYIVFMWFILAQGVKRLHDLDKSGWMILLTLVPLVGWIFGLYILFADGTVGPNHFGPDPKNRTPYQTSPTPVNVTVNINRDEVKVETNSTPKAPVSGEEGKL